MIVIWSGLTLPNALPHSGSRSNAPDDVRLGRFILEKLVLIGLVLAALPLGLAYGGRPSLTEAILFALALMPLAAALLVARAGRFLIANACAIGGEIAIALLLAAVAGAGAGFVWLVLACLETIVGATPRLMRWALPLLCTTAIAIAALDGCLSNTRDAQAPIIAGLCAAFAAALSAWRLRDDAGAHDGALRRGREQALLAVTRDAVAIFDKTGSLCADTSDGIAVLGCSGKELRGRGFFDHLNVADRPLFLKLLADAAHGTGNVGGTLRLLIPAQDATPGPIVAPRTIVLEVRARAAGDEIVAVMRDVTDEVRREGEIETAKRATEAARLAKTNFLGNMSHELRTPLNAIIGFSEMLGSRTMSPSDPAKQREYAGIIHQSGQHLLGTVNAILDMSKIQAGTFVLVPEPFPVQTLAEQCCDALRLQAQAGRIEIVRDVPADLEDLVGDRRVCRQILINLLTNAIKFTPERGSITLRIRPDGTALRISIADTGIGISEADLARLGDPFFQVGSSLNRSYEGAGLGLSVVRGLVGLHGGSIRIESALGEGTVVTLRLPLDCRMAQSDANTTIDALPRRGADDCVRLFEPRQTSSRHLPETRMKQSA